MWGDCLERSTRNRTPWGGFIFSELKERKCSHEKEKGNILFDIPNYYCIFEGFRAIKGFRSFWGEKEIGDDDWIRLTRNRGGSRVGESIFVKKGKCSKRK